MIVKNHDGGTKARVGLVHVQKKANARGSFRKRAHPEDSSLFGDKARPKENVPIALVAPDFEGEGVAGEALTRHVVNGGEGVAQERVLLHPCVKAEVAGKLAAAFDLVATVAEAVDSAEPLHSLHSLEGAVKDAVKGDPWILTEEARGKEGNGRSPLYQHRNRVKVVGVGELVSSRAGLRWSVDALGKTPTLEERFVGRRRGGVRRKKRRLGSGRGRKRGQSWKARRVEGRGEEFGRKRRI